MVRIWVLILVKRGLIQEPEIFFDVSSAKKRKKELLNCFNPDYDEIGIYQKDIKIIIT